MFLKVPNVRFPKVLIHFQHLKRIQPLYKGQNGWTQCALYSDVQLHYYKFTWQDYMYIYNSKLYNNTSDVSYVHMYMHVCSLKPSMYSVHARL